MAARIDGLVPVVKGNGYGLGRDWLADRASLISPAMAVGTVFEVDSVPSNYTAFVLTPTLSVPDDLRANAILTVGSFTHVEAAARSNHVRQRRVLVKIRSSMNRYGVDVSNVDTVVRACHGADLDVVGLSFHPPLTGSSTDHLREIEDMIARVDSSLPIHVSHLEEQDYASLQTTHPDRRFFLRLGTSLWHGDRSEFTLTADVLDVHRIGSDSTAGYRSIPVTRGSRLIVIGCGSTHGVSSLPDGRSPFHFARQRLDLLEPPHMHSSMCIVSTDQPCPDVGESVDVQRPLTTTAVDTVHWA